MTTVSLIREYHNLGADHPSDGFLEMHIPLAEQELRGWLGDTAYDEALSGTADAGKIAAMKAAECELFMYFAVCKLNVNVGDQGITTQINHGDGGTLTVLRPEQVETLQNKYFERAEKVLRRWMPAGLVKGRKVSEE